MPSSPVTISGFKELQIKLEKLPKVIADQVKFELQDSANTIAANAKRDAPKDMGSLAAGISVKKIDSMSFEVVSSSPISPYMEWGTGSRAKIPADESAYAAQFKGKKTGGGNIDEFFLAIMEWVKRKGLAGTYYVKTRKRSSKRENRDSEDFDVAWPIFMSILKKGVNPHPFFFHNFKAEEPKLIEKITKIIENAVK